MKNKKSSHKIGKDFVAFCPKCKIEVGGASENLKFMLPDICPICGCSIDIREVNY